MWFQIGALLWRMSGGIMCFDLERRVGLKKKAVGRGQQKLRLHCQSNSGWNSLCSPKR